MLDFLLDFTNQGKRIKHLEMLSASFLVCSVTFGILTRRNSPFAISWDYGLRQGIVFDALGDSVGEEDLSRKELL